MMTNIQRPILAVILAAAILLLAAALVFGWLDNGDDADAANTVDLTDWDVTTGDLCTVTSSNNQSVHEGNVLLIVHGDQTERVPGVEDAPNTVTETQFTAAGPIVATKVELGPSGDTSLDVGIECEPPPPTSTPTSTSTTVTTSTTTTTPTVTTSTTTSTTTTSLPPTDPEPPVCHPPDYAG